MPNRFYPRKRRGQRKRGPRKPKLSFDKRVLNVLKKKQELKVSRPMSTTANNEVIGQITIANGNVLPIMPSISQGTNEYERVGNEITLKKLVVNAYYKMNLPILTNNQARMMIRHMVVRQRNCESADLVIGTPNVFLDNVILENAAAYSGSIPNWNTPLNHEAFVSRRQLKRIMTAPVTTGTTSQESGNLNESYWMIKYTLTFGQGKKLYFRTGGATAPANFPYFLMHSAAGLGSSAVLPVDACVYNMTTTAYYTDS